MSRRSYDRFSPLDSLQRDLDRRLLNVDHLIAELGVPSLRQRTAVFKKLLINEQKQPAI